MKCQYEYMLSFNRQTVDLKALADRYQEILFPVYEPRFRYVAALRLDGYRRVRGFDLKAFAVYKVGGAENSALAELLRAALAKCRDLLLLPAAVREDSANLLRRHGQRLGVPALLMLLDALTKLPVDRLHHL